MLNFEHFKLVLIIYILYDCHKGDIFAQFNKPISS